MATPTAWARRLRLRSARSVVAAAAVVATVGPRGALTATPLVLTTMMATTTTDDLDRMTST